MEPVKSKTILFITGAFVHHSCWDEWKTYFQSKGYKTNAQPWPFKDAPTAETLRKRQPEDSNLGLLTLEELIEHYVNIVKVCSEKPIIIGHSLGGLITQILVNRDLAAAGVAIHSFPPHGIIPYEFSFLIGGWKALGIFTSVQETYLMSLADWQYAFTNNMTLKEQEASYNKFTIPESKTVIRGGTSNAAKVDFDKPHVPLLLTSGSIDHSIPAHLNNRNFEKYKKNGSVLVYKEFPGRNHFVLNQPTWKEDADYILNWLDELHIFPEVTQEKVK